MSIILYNPYRVVGVLVGSTIREQTKQINKLKQYIDAGLKVADDFSFPVVGKLVRTQVALENAVSKLSLDNDKMSAALFWFYSGNDVTDEPAFNFLKACDSEGALDVWTRLTSKGVVTEKNHSAFQNLSSLLVYEFLKFPANNFNYLERAFKLKIAYLESDFSNELIKAATDLTYKISRKSLQALYFEQIVTGLTANNIVTETQLIRAIANLDFSGKVLFLQKYSEKYSRRIDVLLNTSAEKRKADKSLSFKIGKNIVSQVVDDLSTVELILDRNSSAYVSLCDRVSEGVLQSGIDYFNYFKDSEKDPGSSVKELVKIARTLARGTISIQRCQENFEFIETWVDDKPERDRTIRAHPVLKMLRSIMDLSSNKFESVANAKRLLADTSSSLAQLRIILGSKNDLYLNLSTRIAANAQSMCISEINQFFDEEKASSSSGFSNTYSQRINYTILIEQAWALILVIDKMDLSDSFRLKFKENRSLLQDIRNQTSLSSSAAISSTSRNSTNTPSYPSSKPKSGCYIATMAYGDYEHPQVVVLRSFRDNYLSKSFLGRQFIAVYYGFSPLLVEKLKYSIPANLLIRKVLDLTIKLFRR